MLALAGAISAVGQTPELTTPLPFTTTSLADVLQLDERLTADLTAAMTGTDLEQALDRLEGVTLVDDGDDSTIAFTYARTVENYPLAAGPRRRRPEVRRQRRRRLADVSLVTRASPPVRRPRSTRASPTRCCGSRWSASP